MSSTFNVGTVAPVSKGSWNPLISYNKLNIVTNNNNCYISKRAVPAGTLLSNSTYWDMLTAGVTVAGTWSSSVAYNKLSIVTSTDGTYMAKINVPAGTSLSNTTYWTQLFSGSGGTSIPEIIIEQSQMSGTTIQFTDEQAEIIENEDVSIIVIEVHDSSDYGPTFVWTKNIIPSSSTDSSIYLICINVLQLYSEIVYDDSSKTGTWINVAPEETSNKVTAWSSYPSDTKYPSEKLVYDTITPLQTDYVIASYESNNLAWRKWSSGISEFWGRTVITNVACLAQPWSGVAMYKTSQAISSDLTFPTGLFLTGSGMKVQIYFASSAGTPAFVWGDGSVGTTKPCDINLIRPNPAYLTGRIHYFYQGRWKD